MEKKKKNFTEINYLYMIWNLFFYVNKVIIVSSLNNDFWDTYTMWKNNFPKYVYDQSLTYGPKFISSSLYITLF